MRRLIGPVLIAVAVAGSAGCAGTGGSAEVEVTTSTSAEVIQLPCDAAGSACDTEPPVDTVPTGTTPPTSSVTVPADEATDADRVREAFDIVIGQIRAWEPAFSIAELRLLEAGDADGGVARGCGDARFVRGDAFYCPGDDSMYIDVSFLRGEADDAETFVAVALVVVAHEAGHAWEDQNGYAPDRGSTVVNRELFADCFSGAVMAAIRGSLDEAKRTMYSVGDYAFDRRSHHGTPDQRREAVEYGAVNGHEACDGYLRLS